MLMPSDVVILIKKCLTSDFAQLAYQRINLHEQIKERVKKPWIRPKLLGVDPEGLALASPSGNNGMLHICTTGPDPQINDNVKRALLQELLLPTRWCP